ncbi:M1-specific T cell receptor beta chain [Scophthalmus maximus]|uniref:M1-specific T cell receptor beta chain n=1 Tax=Scophthalmus maximus TaxID=52904 RepID=UPI0015E0956B|nr:M1-specific T cell receptor beta chain [Scophthalmus maximus]
MRPSRLLISIITVICIKGVYLSKEKQVFQTPAELLQKANGEVKLSLTHQIQSYDTILWYRRSAGDNSLKLIGYVAYKNPTVETPFQSHFKVSGDGEDTAFLHIFNLTHPEDSGEYFGAASMHSSKDERLGRTKTSVMMMRQITAQRQETTETRRRVRMISSVTTLTFFVLWAAGVSQSVLITQWPHYISRLPSGSAEMSCYQNDTDYDYMYWYRQLRGGEIQLVGYLVAGSANYEAGFQSGFEAAKSQEKQWSLKIASVQREDEAVYLCAASLHNNRSEAYFGAGTKLTVLEYDVKPPVVKVLGPSSRECRNLKDNERRKTLLCVASDFYPDHVSVSWRVGGQEVSRGVATDNAALRQGENYKITSRLRVSAEDWFKPETEFECIVSFFDGTGNTNHSASIFGGKAPDDVLTREKYLRITQKAKLSYGVFIVKSSIYGAFVVFLVWKLQVCQTFIYFMYIPCNGCTLH